MAVAVQVMGVPTGTGNVTLAVSAEIVGGGLTLSVAVRVVLPWPFVVLVKVIVAGP